MCAAASHTSATVPTLDRASDVAHCAQNFGKCEIDDISVQYPKRPKGDCRRREKDDEGSSHRGSEAGASKPGQARSPEDAASKPRETTRRPPVQGGLSSREEGQPKQTPRETHPVKATLTVSMFLPPVGQRPFTWVTQQNVSYTRPTAALVQGSLRNQTVHPSPCGLPTTKEKGWLSCPSLSGLCGLQRLNNECAHWVRWPGITTQCADAIAHVGALGQHSATNKNPIANGPAEDSSAVSEEPLWLSSESTCHVREKERNSSECGYPCRTLNRVQ